MTSRRFARFAWGVLVYTVFVILWGAAVRATGSGAGCGDHWPLCNGDLVPRAPETATLIEFGHRLTSGLVGVLALGLVWGAWRAFPKGHAARRGAVWTLVLTITEGALGAGLVKLELVALNVSLWRAVAMAAHLVNTLFLLAALTLTASAAVGGAWPRVRGTGRIGAIIYAALGAFCVLGASGAVTALGDTLTLAGGLTPAEYPLVATLIGLRIYHPLLALATWLLVGVAWAWTRASGDTRAARLGAFVVGGMLVQGLVGYANVLLLAPVWLQLVHLAVTDVLWVTTVLFAAEATAARAASHARPAVAPPTPAPSAVGA